MENSLSIMMDDEPCIACLPGRVYQVADPVKRTIDPRWGVALVVQCDGMAVSPLDYTTLHAAGTIVFRHPRPDTAAITVSGAYLT